MNSFKIWFEQEIQNNLDPSSATSALHKRWTDYRQQQIQQGQAAHDLSIFETYNQIFNLIKAIDKKNYRHSRIISMIQRGIGENYDVPTTIMPQQQHSEQNIYQLEKKLISVQKQVSVNEYSLRDILKRRGIDMHKHLRRAAGFKGLAENDQTMDYQPFNKVINNNQNLGLDGPRFFRSIEHLESEINRIFNQTFNVKSLIDTLFQKTGGIPQPYKPDPESVLD